MLLEDIPFCQQNGMRANLFESAGYWAVALMAFLHSKKGNLSRLGRIMTTLPCGHDLIAPGMNSTIPANYRRKYPQ